MASEIALIASGVRIEMFADVVDGYLTDDHQLTVDHTSYPVQTGGDLVDHAVVRPERYTVVGFVSNLFATVGVNASLPARQRPRVAWERLREVLRAREPMKITTPLRDYEDMLMASLSAKQDENTGRALLFNIAFTEIQFRDVLETAGSGVTAAPGSEWNDRVVNVDLGYTNPIPLSPTVIGV